MAPRDPVPDARPPVWIGHVSLATPEIPKTREFLVRLGMRPIAEGDDFAVLELRGGTHLVLLRSDDAVPGDAGFDLMVDDLEATRKSFLEAGLAPSEVSSGRIHSSFSVTSPAGHRIRFNSTHVSDLPV